MGLFNKIVDMQKLDKAWEKVRKNKPAAGVDQISFEDFEINKSENLKQLNIELKENTYEPLPVKMIKIYKGEKARDIALFSMRDKVVQQSIAIELGKMYEPDFSHCAYAYMSGKSALQALEVIEKKVKDEAQLWVLKVDIVHFFDNIVHEKLLRQLRLRIKEDDVIELIHQQLMASVLSVDGDLKKNKKGIFQGSGCAPVLSNIYLMEFDKQMESRCEFYIRYSDDLLIVDSDMDRVQKILDFIKKSLEVLGLEVKESKTTLHQVSAGFEYLGHYFDDSGKSIPQKAEASLEARLETMWLTSGIGIKEKIKKGQEIIGGWEQYYREDREIKSILEYVVVLSMALGRETKKTEIIIKKRFQYQNDYKDIMIYLSELWKERQDKSYELKEYEQFYHLGQMDADIKIDFDSPSVEELLGSYRQFNVLPTEELYTMIMQLYTDLYCFNKASVFMEQKNIFEKSQKHVNILTVDLKDSGKMEKWSQTVLNDYTKLFVGREDLYAQEVFEEEKHRGKEQILEPLTDEVIKRHLSGEQIITTYIQRTNSTVKYLVFDVDISKKILLQYAYESEEFKAYKNMAANYTANIQKQLQHMGLTGYIEDSGYRGYHLWVFFTEWIPVRYVNMLTDYMEKHMEEKEEITVEFFPNKTRVRDGKLGQCIKLPLGLHIRTGKWSSFLNDDFTVITDYGEYFRNIAKYSLSAIRKVLGVYSLEKNQDPTRKVVEEDLSAFGNMSESAKVVLEKCTLMRYLCQKAYTTGYLSHFERLSILYVFGHLGDEGKEFIHTVMGFTLNYQYNVTDRFIQKLPQKPISCLKLRDQYKKITAEYGCSCNFRRTKNCYPSPVLHAVKSADIDQGNITIPTSRTISKAKEQTVYEEINIHKKTQELASKILEMKKQKRGLDKSICKVERELEQVFDNAGVDCLEIEMGMLMRRKKDEGYEWLIEI